MVQVLESIADKQKRERFDVDSFEFYRKMSLLSLYYQATSAEDSTPIVIITHRMQHLNTQLRHCIIFCISHHNQASQDKKQPTDSDLVIAM